MIGGVAVGVGIRVGIRGVIGEVRLSWFSDELMLLARDDGREVVGGDGKFILASILGNPGDSDITDALGTAKLGCTVRSVGCSEELLAEFCEPKSLDFLDILDNCLL